MSLLELADQYRWIATLVLWVSAGWKLVRMFTKGDGLSSMISWVAALVLATWILLGNGIEQMTRLMDWAFETLPDLLERVDVRVGCDPDTSDCPTTEP